MKKIFVYSFVLSLALISCKKNVKNNTLVEKAADSITTAVYEADSTNALNGKITSATGDTTENSVTWEGAYSGTLPCASCPGIETRLILKDDKTYELSSTYIDEKDGKFNDKGTFKFSNDGSFITLTDSKDAKEQKVFFVGEGYVWMAEKVGDRSMKKEYRLVKE